MINLDFQFRYKNAITPILSLQKIEAHAQEFLEHYSKENPCYSFENPCATPIEEIIELHCGLKMDYKTFPNNNILGASIFTDGILEIINDEGIAEKIFIEKNTIIISNELVNDEKLIGRYNFTLGHELGHHIYHTKVYSKNNETLMLDFSEPLEKDACAKICMRSSVEHSVSLQPKTDEEWREWQADNFSSCLLMPKKSVYNFFKPYLSTQEEFSLSSEEKPLLSYLSYSEKMNLLEEFKKCFAVSKTAAKIRLEKLNYIKRNEL